MSMFYHGSMTYTGSLWDNKAIAIIAQLALSISTSSLQNHALLENLSLNSSVQMPPIADTIDKMVEDLETSPVEDWKQLIDNASF